MDEKSVLLAITTKLFNKTENEILTELYNGDELKENATDVLYELDAKRVKLFKDKETDAFNNGVKKATSESLGKFETSLIESLGLESGLKGDELKEAIRLKLAEKPKGKIEDVKTHPDFLLLEKKLKEEKENAIKEWEEKYNNTINGFEKNKRYDTARNEAVKIVDGLNLVFSSDPVKASNQKALLVNEILGKFDDLQITDNQIIALKEGKRIEDAHGNMVKFENIVKDTSLQYYDVKQHNDPKAPPSNPSNPPSNATINISDIKTIKQYNEAMKKTTDAKERVELLKFYDANRDTLE